MANRWCRLVAACRLLFLSLVVGVSGLQEQEVTLEVQSATLLGNILEVHLSGTFSAFEVDSFLDCDQVGTLTFFKAIDELELDFVPTDLIISCNDPTSGTLIADTEGSAVLTLDLTDLQVIDDTDILAFRISSDFLARYFLDSELVTGNPCYVIADGTIVQAEPKVEYAHQLSPSSFYFEFGQPVDLGIPLDSEFSCASLFEIIGERSCTIESLCLNSVGFILTAQSELLLDDLEIAAAIGSSIYHTSDVLETYRYDSDFTLELPLQPPSLLYASIKSPYSIELMFSPPVVLFDNPGNTESYLCNDVFSFSDSIPVDALCNIIVQDCDDGLEDICLVNVILQDIGLSFFSISPSYELVLEETKQVFYGALDTRFLFPSGTDEPIEVEVLAPVLTSVDLERDGTTKLFLNFRTELDNSSLLVCPTNECSDCLQISSGDLDLINPDMQCTFSWFDSTKILVVFEEKQPALFLNTSWTLALELRVDTEANTFVAFGESTFNTEEEFPEFSLIYPREISNCDILFEVQIVQSYGSAADVFFTYSFTSEAMPTENITSTQNPILNLEEYFVSNGFFFSIYIIESSSLRVISSFEQRFVEYLAQPQLPIEISGVLLNQANAVERRFDEQIIVSAGVKRLDGECQKALSDSGPALFQWEILDTENNQVNVDSVLTRNSLVIKPRELRAGTYTIRVGVSGPETFSPNVQTFDLVILPAEIAVQITGGDFVTTSTGEDFLLSAARSCNPNMQPNCTSSLGLNGGVNVTGLENVQEFLGFPVEEFEISWSCSGCPTEMEFPNEMEVSIPAEFLPASSTDTYQFTFTVTPANELISPRSADIVLSVQGIFEQDCPLPVVAIESTLPRIRSDSPWILFAEVSIIPQGANLSWEVLRTDAVEDPIFLPSTDQTSLFIPANSLSEGARYTFTLSARPNCAIDGAFPIAQASVSLETNRRPTGLSVTLLESSLTNGRAVFDNFQFQAFGAQDPEADAPFEYAFETISVAGALNLPADFEFNERDTRQLRGFSLVSNIDTFLPMPGPGEDLVLIALVRDSLGSVSRRLVRSTIIFPTGDIRNPFLDQNGALDLTAANPDAIQALLDVLILSGNVAQVSNLCGVVGSALNGVGDPAEESVNDALKEVRELCVDSSRNSFNELVTDGQADLDLSSSVADSLKSLSANPAQLDSTLAGSIIGSSNEVLGASESILVNTLNGVNDPFAASVLSVTLPDNVIGAASNLIQRTQTLSSQQRILIERAVFLPIVLSPPSAPQLEVVTESVTISTVRSEAARTGEIGLVTFPGITNFVRIPPSISGDLTSAVAPLATVRDVSLLATKWNVQIEASSTGQTTEDTDSPESICADPSDLEFTDAPTSPSSIVSVNFYAIQSNELSFTPEPVGITSLSESIEIGIDSPIDGGDSDLSCVVGENSCNEFEESFETVCGVYIQETNEWIVNDTALGIECSLLDRNTTAGISTCACNYISDYLAWDYFKRQFLEGPEPLSELGLWVFRTVLPIVALVMGLVLAWAIGRDKQDADIATKGALARILLNRFMVKYQKEKFFKLVNERPVPSANEDKIVDLNANLAKKDWKRQFQMALKYEHSLFGLSRYNPNFSRWQRVSVFFAVVFANFGAAAMLYSFRSFDVSFWVSLVTAIAAAFIVSIAIKLVVRAIFKGTENKVASQNDIASNLYRILGRVERGDGLMSKADAQLVANIVAYFHAQRNMDYAKTQSKPPPLTMLDRVQRSDRLATSLSSRVLIEQDPNEVIGAAVAAEEVDVQNPPPQNPNPPPLNPNPPPLNSNPPRTAAHTQEPATAQVATPEEVEADPNYYYLDIVQAEVVTRWTNVQEATLTSRAEWRALRASSVSLRSNSAQQPVEPNVRSRSSRIMAYYNWTSERRNLALSYESSRSLQIIALAADEPSDVARPRMAVFSRTANYANSIFLTLIIGGLAYFTYVFISTRESDVGDFLRNPECLSEDGQFRIWLADGLLGLAISYLIAEPLILLLRYVAAPNFLSRFKKSSEKVDSQKKSSLNPMLNEEELATPEVLEAEMVGQYDTKEVTLTYGIEIFAELVESFF